MGIANFINKFGQRFYEVAQNSAYHGQLKLHQRLRSRPAATNIQSAEADFATVAAISNRLTTNGLSNHVFTLIRVRLRQLGLTASIRPLHATDVYPMIEKSVGSRASRVYLFKDLLRAGVPLSLGSDCPVADPNPLWGIHAAVTRQMRAGVPIGGWYPDQRLRVSEAIWGYTMGPALASGQEKISGSLTPGKLADLIVLDRDIFAIAPMAIAGAQVAITVVAGRIVYRA